MFVCSICDAFAAPSYSSVLRHLASHQYDPGLHIVCGIDGCPLTYRNFQSFRSHIYRKHRAVLEGGLPRADSDDQQAPEPTIDVDEESPVDLLSEFSEGSESIDTPDTQKQAALFLLKTREERRITQAALNGIVGDVKGLWSQAMQKLQETVLQRLSQQPGGVSAEEVRECFGDTTPFDGLETEHLQRRYYKEHFGLLVSYIVVQYFNGYIDHHIASALN